MLDTKALAEATALIVREHVEKATAPLVAENKALADRIAELEKRSPERGETGPAGEAGPKGEDGKDIDADALAALVDDAVARAVAQLPPPERGEPGPQGAKGDDGAKGADGKDGAGIADLLIDRDGALVTTFTDGRIKGLGPIVGKDGSPGQSGADGKDGLGFDDLAFEHDGERAFKLVFARGEQRKEFAFEVPVVIDRGVWREGAYKTGDGTTWAGSYWIAQKDTDAKPDSGDGWRLAVKRGRDGKDKAA